jgi:hypothetical protein
MTLVESHSDGLSYRQKQLACTAVMALQDVFVTTPRDQRQELLDYVYQQIITQVFHYDGGYAHAESR